MLMVYQNLAGSHKLSAQYIVLCLFQWHAWQKVQVIAKKGKKNKLKSAWNKVARLTPKWPNGGLSLNLGLNTNKFD